MVGITSYGAYVPRYRIRVEDIAKEWGADSESYKRGLFLNEKSVAGMDEDTITMSLEATRNALRRAAIDPNKVGAVYVGSESHPYAVKPSSTIIAEAINAVPHCHCADLEFACKAGTESLFITYGLVKAGLITYGLAIGADTSQGAPNDALEYSAASGAAAFFVGTENIVANIEATYSCTTDTPDFWRRDNQVYPRHGGRFTGTPAYFKHVHLAGKMLLEKTGVTPAEIKYAVFHQPNGKFPQRVSKMLGFSKDQIKAGLLAPSIGNTYSASSLISLTAVLDIAEKDDLIMMVSYGSGAGSDAFLFRVTDAIYQTRDKAKTTMSYVNERLVYLDYGLYAKYRDKIIIS
ncbi:hydroxymethylglutaryl-CoA synthase [candidate division KSB1 bacterium]|nr:hydroxymethylglutaryl-CoA synthase [candidate division KSB1 bacterium]